MALDVEATRAHLQQIYAEGFRSIAVCLMHSSVFPDHELQIEEIAREMGFEHISVSHRVSQRPKIVPRGNSTVIDFYLTPTIERYLSQFSASFPSFDNDHTKLEFMQSDGVLVPASKLSGLHAILSGPAGGVVGYARTSYDPESKIPIIGFDMGGTSTDVSRYDGQFDHIFETTTAGIPIQAPQLNVNTIAAGGGSILVWKDSLMAVGPQSASSHPGPACYRNGGPLTVTDANLALGRLIPEHFPSVFGPNEDEPLDREIVLARFQELTDIINHEIDKSLTWAEVADGFLQVTNTVMCGPIRQLTEGRGHDAAKHHLASFGGAGGQHACAIAEALGIRHVLIHKHSSILSAYGIGLADVVHDEERPYAKVFDNSTRNSIYADLEGLSLVARNHPTLNHFSHVDGHQFLFMQYDGSETALMVPVKDGGDPKQEFIDAHHQQFGFSPVDRRIFVDNIRVRAVARSDFGDDTPPSLQALQDISGKIPPATPASTKSVYFRSPGWVDTPVYLLGSLPVGSTVQGPALVVDNTQTIVIDPHCSATATKDLLVLDVGSEKKVVSATTIDPVQLPVFRHRFYGVAEQMGRVLQKVSVTANIKERLD